MEFRGIIATLFSYVGATDAAVGVLLPDEEDRLRSLELETIIRECTDPMARLRIVREYLRKRQHDVATRMDDIYAQWIRATSSPLHSASLPVLEHTLEGVSGIWYGGMLRRMYVKYFSISEDGKDHLHVDSSMSEEEGNPDDVGGHALGAARSLLSMNGVEEISCGIGFEPREFLQKGRSGGLALAMLLYCAIIRLRGERVQVRVRGDVASTGDIAGSGEVLPVDSKGLEEKVGIIFFSPMRTFVVPAGQVPLAEAEVQRLQRDYPHRTLEIIGVRHLRDAVNDLRVVETRKSGRIAHVARRAWRHRAATIGVGGVLAVLAVVLWFTSGHLDQEPELLDIRGQVLLVENKFGQVLREVPVGEETMHIWEGDPEQMRTMAVLLDVNGDGKKELLYGMIGKEDGVDELRCMTLDGDTILWRYVFQKSVRFPGNPEISDSRFHFFTFLAGDLEGDGRLEVVAIANHIFFPSLVVKLDARTGKEMDFFLNTGQLASLVLLSPAGKYGLRTVVVGGTNNAFREAAVAVFDPRFIHGCSPSRGAYVPEGLGPGLEMRYVLIPKTAVGNVNPSPGRGSGVNQILLGEERNQFVVRVTDSAFLEGNGTREIYPMFFLTFNSLTKVLDVGTSTDYDGLADKLVRTGFLSRPPDNEYWKSYRKTLRYWNGEGWEDTVSVNRLYVRAALAATVGLP